MRHIFIGKNTFQLGNGLDDLRKLQPPHGSAAELKCLIAVFLKRSLPYQSSSRLAMDAMQIVYRIGLWSELPVCI
jgi:hypothetical protein